MPGHYRCPACTGTFPADAADEACPWCETAFGDVDPDRQPVARVTATRDSDATAGGALGFLRGDP